MTTTRSVLCQASSLRETAHRPWPPPERHCLLGQSWLDLLFAHWAVDPELVAGRIPAGLRLDTYDGRAWLGVTPFVVTGLRLARTPPLPLLSTFPELNVRTYVTCGGKPGIWFFSLDAASRLAVAGARRAYRLPYFHARMRAERDGDVHYESRRTDRRGHDARLAAVYRPTGPSANADAGTVEWFLTERYCLYALAPGGQLLRAEIHHRPWELRPAEAEIVTNTMPPPDLGPGLVAEKPLLHYASRQDVLIWSPEPAGPHEGEG